MARQKIFGKRKCYFQRSKTCCSSSKLKLETSTSTSNIIPKENNANIIIEMSIMSDLLMT